MSNFDLINDPIQKVLAQYLDENALTQETLVIACSGGKDSVVLLHALSVLQQTQYPALKLEVLHVNHGLQASARDFARLVERHCEILAIKCRVLSVNVMLQKGESVEALARQARYQGCFEAMEQDKLSHLFTAHHADDQVETLFLQLFRGAGVKGLSCMPLDKKHGNKMIHRPFLFVSSEDLQAYIEDFNLDFIEDPTNSDVTFDRNFLRHAILPLIKKRFLGFQQAVGRSVKHLAQAQKLLDELALIDEAQLIENFNETGYPEAWGSPYLPVSGLLDLSSSRRDNVLRHWLSIFVGILPSMQKMLAITNNLLEARLDSQAEVKWATYALRRHGDRVYLIQDTRVSKHLHHDLHQWDVQKTFEKAPWCFTIEASRRQLIANKDDHVEIFFRQGGEVLQLENHAHHTSLKKVLHAHGVPPWLRDQIPLVKVNGIWRAILLPQQTLFLKISDSASGF